MIICTSCQTPNEDAADFCDECGARLVHALDEEDRPAVRADSHDDRRAQAARAVPFVLVSTPTVGNSAAPMTSAAVSPSNETSISDGSDPIDLSASPLTLATSQKQNTVRGRAAGRQVSYAARDSAASSVAPEPHAELVIERGRSAGKSFLINEAEANIGRWDADGGVFPDIDLDADDPEAKVSRRHARVLRRPDGYYIEDLGSTNGTFVNRGRRLLPGSLQPLHDGDEIIVGKTFLRLRVIK